MSLEERIERLERTNRRYRLMFTLLGALAVCAVGMSAAPDAGVRDVIRAKAFEVVDDVLTDTRSTSLSMTTLVITSPIQSSENIILTNAMVFWRNQRTTERKNCHIVVASKPKD